MQALFPATLQLGARCLDEREWLDSYFGNHFFEADLEIESDDPNVQMLVSAINDALAIRAQITFYE